MKYHKILCHFSICVTLLNTNEGTVDCAYYCYHFLLSFSFCIRRSRCKSILFGVCRVLSLRFILPLFILYVDDNKNTSFDDGIILIFLPTSITGVVCEFIKPRPWLCSICSFMALNGISCSHLRNDQFWFVTIIIQRMH